MSDYEGRDNNTQIIKVVTVGESGVGKSNLISRYVHDKFYIGANITVGSQVDSKKISLNNNQPINLHIWDTAGQERYRSLNKTFYRNALGALVVFDLGERSTFQKLDRWIVEIRDAMPENYILLLIGNKCDLKDQTISVEQATEYARKQGMGYLETSAALNINVSLAFETLAEKICKIESQVPLSTILPQSPTKSQSNHYKQSIVIGKKDVEKKKKKKQTCCS